MSYLVLARKYRPRSFDTLIGQDHVVRALTHALATQRLHHAWLFTGTRGVGKTTLSRILAKSLNCETGITATPCGQCRACTEIDAGRFVDYVELDAASNRGIDDMTQLLEQAVYAPSAARFKVYMIDEVHMLTGPAFNAMLKTLEEPPPHVKFILATTDPQKIPVTVLSRCLQFNLKQMTGEAIVQHLRQVLGEESVPFEDAALRLIGQAAAGSMRDALSLTDQAIAYSANNLTAEAVQGMLGTIDQRHLIDLLRALAHDDAGALIAVADDLAARGLSYAGALADLSTLLSRIAIAQRLGRAVPADDPLADDVLALAQALQPDQVQLFYTIAVHSRQELSLAPDAYAGFVMACLRMLALGPAPDGARTDSAPPKSHNHAAATTPTTTAPSVPTPSPPPDTVSATQRPIVAASSPTPVATPSPVVTATPSAPDPAAAAKPSTAPTAASLSASSKPDIPAWEDDIPDDSPAADHAYALQDIPDDIDGAAAQPQQVLSADDDLPLPDLPHGVAPKTAGKPDALNAMTRERWPVLAAALPVTGMAAELARQSEWISGTGSKICLRVAVHSLARTQGKARLRTVLSEHFGVAVDLHIEFGTTGDDTAHAVAQAAMAARHQRAEQSAQSDPFVQTLMHDFGAHLVPGSVQATPSV